jgi:hypothetical protein
MPKLKVSVPHNIGEKDAKERIVNLINILKEEYKGQVSDVHESWEGDKGSFSFKIMGFSVNGDIIVDPRTVHLEGNLPLAAVPFKGRIESTIKSRMETLLS